ncbi:MAG TPA: OmpA family protein [Chitinophagaceae bacterium]|nr:OmpA family protein [Chitinophagaceae bacterium]
MKPKIIAAALLLVICGTSQAQLGNLLKKVKGKVNQRVNNKVDNAIDKSLDAIEGKGGNAAAANGSSDTAAAAVVSYAQYDFVPGEEVLYANDFAHENQGELPVGWNSSGNAAVVTLNTQKGNWLQVHQNTLTLTDNDSLFTGNCTVEFDIIFHQSFNGYVLPQLQFGLIGSGDLSSTDNALLRNIEQGYAAEIKIQPGTQNDTHLHLQTYATGSLYLNTDIKNYRQMQALYDKPVHVAIQVQKERLRVWLNAEKMYDLPKAIPPGTILNQLYFSLKSSAYNDAQNGYYIGNIKVARGLPDTRHKLVDEGKFTTTGILFNVNTADIQPESNGVLKEVASVLLQYPGIKILITGHTDGDGSNEDNLVLSQKRADAVKDALVNNYNIDASRIQTTGKGEDEPVADNNTRQGKAQNRRVEFSKL